MEDKRLIDANALKRHMIAFATGCHTTYLTVDTVVMMISQAETVDTAEVVHGQWVAWYPPMHMIMTGEEMLYRCSACDAKYPDVEGYRFCPRCGTIMDGGADHV